MSIGNGKNRVLSLSKFKQRRNTFLKNGLKFIFNNSKERVYGLGERYWAGIDDLSIYDAGNIGASPSRTG